MTTIPAAALPVVFIPALLCDDTMYRDVINTLGSSIDAQVLMSPKPHLQDSVADILSRAPARFALVGTSYGSNLALEVALAAPERVTALWLMGCDPSAPKTGGPDLAGGLDTTPDAVIDMLAGLVVSPQSPGAANTFRQMAQRVGGKAGADQARAAASRAEATSRLATLTMPMLLVWGEQDPLVPVAIGQGLADALPHARFEVLPDCGHLPTLEKPDVCASLFQGLLQDI